MELEIDPSGIIITDTTTNTNKVTIDSSNIDISGTHKISLNDTNGISINNLTLQPTNTLGTGTNITIDELSHLSGVSSNIQTQFNLLKGDAPAALDTIAELADAIGDNANFLTGINTDIAGKVGKTGDETISGIKSIEGTLNFNTNGNISGNVIPLNNNLTNIGSTSKQINNIYTNHANISGDINVTGDINMNGNIDICGGNFTITNEELSKLDGVSDNIQTQINTAIAGNVWDVNGVKIYYNSGNVGIGTNNPLGKLEVHDGPIIVKPGTNATNALQFHSGSGNTYYTNDIAWYDNNGTKKVMIGSSTNNTTTHFRFWENGSQDFTFINDTNNTKLGINRVDPQYELDVTGDINFTGNLYQDGSVFNPSLWSESTGNVYRSSGNVGIGTTNPAEKLHVNGDIAAKYNGASIYLGPGADTNNSLRLHYVSNNAYLDYNDTNDGLHMRAYTSGANQGTALFLKNNANVGIKNTNPSYELDVTGDINFTGTLYQNGSAFSGGGGGGGGGAFTSSSGKAYYTGGNVGIGTANPNEKLHVHDSGSICSLLVSNGSSGDQPKEGIRLTSSSESDGNGHGAIEFIENHINNGPMNYGFAMGYAGSGASNPTSYAWLDNNFCISRFHNSTYGILALNIKRTSNNLYSKGSVFANGNSLSSDSRIKTDISNIDDTIALQKVNAIENKEYNYIDPERKLPMKTIGFIAQQVREVLPNAVTIETQWIPDEMRKIENPVWIDCSYNTIRYESKTTYTETVSYEEGPLLDGSGNPVLDQSGNQIMDPSAVQIVDPSGIEHIDPSGIVIEEWHPQWKLQIPDLDINNDNCTGNVRFSVDDNIAGNNISNIDVTCEKDASGNNTNIFILKEKYPYVFIWGKEVNDFHYLDKNQIFSLHHSAIQELSRKNDALVTEKEIMQTQITGLLEENNSMKSRLEALEAAIINLQNS